MFQTPLSDCSICPRLCGFRADNQRQYPDFFNAPVPSFGNLDARLLVVGLAPGLKGANQTGRPFTGDYAGLILYSSLKKCGFTKGNYNPDSFCHLCESRDLILPQDSRLRGNDNFTLIDCRITNAVRCVPPQNKPETSEIKNCNAFLKNEIAAMPNLRVILSLGLVSHNAVLKALGLKAGAAKFVHGAEHVILSAAKDLGKDSSASPQNDIILLDSYHCSRYNINTRVLTQEMFDAVVARAKALLSA